MYKENLLIYLKGPEGASYEEDLMSEQLPNEDSESRIAQGTEYAEAAATMAMSIESGNWAEATKTFYETYLETPDKMKGYRDFMMMTTNPISWFTRNVPILGLAAKLQIQITDKAIEKLFGIMTKVKNMADNSPSFQALQAVHGEWDKLDEEDKEAVKTMLAECVK